MCAMNIYLGKPNEKQMQFFNAKARHIAYGGS